jgi:hypothetical protein
MSDRKIVFSADRKYRYTLWREFGGDLIWEGINKQKEGFVQFIGLNPSTADETQDDPTIRRCIAFAKSWGYGAMCMTNLFAFRATDPKAMMATEDPIGNENDTFITRIATDASLVVCAWGRGGNFNGRGILVCEMLRRNKIIPHHLGLNADWTPKHPLYLRKTLTPISYDS